jgi:hypothetical protein
MARLTDFHRQHGYNLTIGGGAERFSTEDKLFKPHIQKGHMFSITNSTILHMLGDISSPAAHILGFQTMRRFDTTIPKRVSEEDISKPVNRRTSARVRVIGA